MPSLTFQVLSECGDSQARTARVTTPHGSFDTPAFMPVATRAVIKGLAPQTVTQLGSEVVLANTYHLMLRPGSELIGQMGGLHRWMRWGGSILTDSGGFQVFSLSDINQITDEAVVFKSHLDGSQVTLTPRRAMEVQNQLGADIIMALDDCPPAAPDGGANTKSSDHADRVEAACERSVRWLAQCVQAHARKQDQALFGIVQGGVDLDRRSWCATRVTQHDLPGYAIGGVAVGEGYEGLRSVVEHTAPLLPADRPRYLMGVGYERDILAAVRAGVDMFDCVLPTRNGRNAYAFTSTGALRLRNAKYAQDPRVIQEGCDCPACSGCGLDHANDEKELHSVEGGFTRSYLRHLFMSGEMLGPILVSAHNIRHFQRYMLDIRRAISDNDWSLIDRCWPIAKQDTQVVAPT